MGGGHSFPLRQRKQKAITEEDELRQFCQTKKQHVVGIIVVGLPDSAPFELNYNYAHNYIPNFGFDANPDDHWRIMFQVHGGNMVLDLLTTCGPPNRQNLYLQVKGRDACVLLYNAENRNEFEALSAIHKIIQGFKEKPRVTKLVANQIEVEKDKWTVAPSEGRAMAEEMGIAFREVDARIGTGVHQLMMEIAEEILLERSRQSPDPLR